MITIYKYKIPSVTSKIHTFSKFKVLAAKTVDSGTVHGEELFVWILGEAGPENREITFKVFNTGDSLPKDNMQWLEYVDTVIFKDGTVQHVFYQNYQSTLI